MVMFLSTFLRYGTLLKSLCMLLSAMIDPTRHLNVKSKFSSGSGSGRSSICSAMAWGGCGAGCGGSLAAW